MIGIAEASRLVMCSRASAFRRSAVAVPLGVFPACATACFSSVRRRRRHWKMAPPDGGLIRCQSLGFFHNPGKTLTSGGERISMKRYARACFGKGWAAEFVLLGNLVSQCRVQPM